MTKTVGNKLRDMLVAGASSKDKPKPICCPLCNNEFKELKTRYGLQCVNCLNRLYHRVIDLLDEFRENHFIKVEEE